MRRRFKKLVERAEAAGDEPMGAVAENSAADYIHLAIKIPGSGSPKSFSCRGHIGVTACMNGSLIAQARPLIVTARLDRASQKYFDELRKQYFPPERNYVPAHLTICHALPGDAIDEVTVVLNQVANGKPSPSAEISGVRSLGNGVAFTIRSPGLERVRREIAAAFFGRLTRQDAQSWRPHITVQNKVTRESARELMTRLQGVFQPWTATAERLDLWYYDGGPWEFVRCFRFEIPG